MSARVFETISDPTAAFGDRGPLMGLDLGTKTIGVAVSDVAQSVASPLETIRRKRFAQDAARLCALIQHRRLGGVVLGLPRNMNGSEGFRCQSTRAFAQALAQRIAVPIAFWDERLSTMAAERALRLAQTTRQRRKQVVDRVAAAYILQGALDRLSHARADNATPYQP